MITNDIIKAVFNDINLSRVVVTNDCENVRFLWAIYFHRIVIQDALQIKFFLKKNYSKGDKIEIEKGKIWPVYNFSNIAGSQMIAGSFSPTEEENKKTGTAYPVSHA